MKKNEFYEGMVTSLKFPNKGIVYVEDEDAYVQVKNTLPGQRVRFQLKKVKKKRPEGNLTEVLVPSEIEKAVPPCPHFSECGGCAYQTLPYEEQKKLKLNQVKALLDAVYPEFPLDECVESPRIWEYRNKMEFSFGDEVKDGPLTLGLHKRGSFYDIVSVPDCQIIDEDLRKVLKTTQDFFRNAKLGGKSIDFYHKMRHEGVLRHLLVRKGLKTGEMLICLVTSSQGGIDSAEGKQLLGKYKDTLLALETTGTFAGILHMTNDSLSDVVKADAVDILYGKDYFYDELLGLRFRITPFSFFQTFCPDILTSFQFVFMAHLEFQKCLRLQTVYFHHIIFSDNVCFCAIGTLININDSIQIIIDYNELRNRSAEIKSRYRNSTNTKLFTCVGIIHITISPSI